MDIRIDRCICYNRTFEELKKIMRDKGFHTIDELQNEVDVSKNCKLCRPYIKKMIETGQTVFTEIINE